MPLLVPAARSQSWQRNFSGRPDASWGTTLTASATPHALPASPTEVISSTTYEAEWIRIMFHGSSAASTITDALCNIYIGGAGSETLFIDSLPAGWSANPALGAPPRSYWFPVRIPRGTRISASLRALIASDTCYIMVEVGNSNGAHWVGSGVETLGEDTAASRGTSATPGASSEGSDASIGTTGRRWRYVIVEAQGNNDSSLTATWMAWDITDGTSILQGLENKMQADNASEWQANWTDHGWWCDIPSGTALYVQGQSYTTPFLHYVTLHGVY